MKYIPLLFLLCFHIGYSQEIVDYFRFYDLEKSKSFLENDNNLQNETLVWQQDFLENFDSKSAIFKSIEGIKLLEDKGIRDFYYYINWGDYYFYNYLDKGVLAMENYREALNFAKKTANIKLECEALKKILTLHRIHYLYDNNTYISFLNRYKDIAYDLNENLHYHYYNLILNFKNYNVDKWDINSKNVLDKSFKSSQNHFLKGNIYTVYASYFEEIKLRDSIWHYIELAEKEYKSIPYGYKNSRLNNLYSFKARIALAEKKYVIAKQSIEEATKHIYNSTDFIITTRGYYQQSVIDSLDGNYASAYQNAVTYRSNIDKLDKAKYNELFNELEIKYETAEKEKEILLQKQKKERNKNIAIGLGSLLLLGAVIFALIQQSTRRKQRIAEQEREIEIQKTEKILKEQELNTIDAMLAGQEKERQKLAEDLHDSVGATLAAAKLQFNHLSQHRDKLEEMDELFSKTGTLLDDAYSEIRAMAHLKNSGVIAKNGLLPALEKLAKNASSTNGLKVSIENFGLEQRLESGQEITIFRVIQELVTNIIKHAKATEASISLTPHESELSIIIEDNGVGFNPRAIKKDGMGLSNIERRIEHLEGSMEVDSTPGKGTTILIDIPL